MRRMVNQYIPPAKSPDFVIYNSGLQTEKYNSVLLIRMIKLHLTKQ
jgi:hypothetical protein